jgi:DNA-binding response OmpR family regulator
MGRNRTVFLQLFGSSVRGEFFRRTLEMAGYTVVTAENYATAVAAFEAIQSEIRLLITDVALPGKNGVDLARTLLGRMPEAATLALR